MEYDVVIDKKIVSAEREVDATNNPLSPRSAEVWVNKEAFPVLNYHNPLKFQEKYGYGKTAVIKSVVTAVVYGGGDSEKNRLLRTANN